MSFRTVLVGHDLKEGGKDALALGSALANATGAKLLVAKVFPLEVVPFRDREAWHAREVEQLAELIRESEVVGASPDVFASSSRGRGLYELAEEAGADLVVIGSSSRGTVERAVVGDVAMVLLHGASCAVAVAPRGYRGRSGPIGRITVGYDGSPDARSALDEAFALARAAGAAVSVVSVPRPAAHGPGPDDVRHLAPAGVEVHTEVVEGDPATVLLDAAGHSDLLVLGSRGYGPVKRVLLGSVSAELLRSSSTPVLVFPRGAPPAAAAAPTTERSVAARR